MDPWDFALQFMQDYDSMLSGIIKQHLIPNRYSENDVKQYICARIVEILRRRSLPENSPINNPVGYFKTCLVFYCREFQREHGYTFSLPRRPRKYCEEHDAEARSRKYKYLDVLAPDEIGDLVVEDNTTPSAGPLWHALTGVLTQEQADILDCVVRRNLTWSETSRALGIPQSTCWFRRQQAYLTIFSKLDLLSGEMASNIQRLLRDSDFVQSVQCTVFSADSAPPGASCGADPATSSPTGWSGPA